MQAVHEAHEARAVDAQGGHAAPEVGHAEQAPGRGHEIATGAARGRLAGVAQDHVALLDEALLARGQPDPMPAAIGRLLDQLEARRERCPRLGPMGRHVGLAVDEGHEAHHVGHAAASGVPRSAGRRIAAERAQRHPSRIAIGGLDLRERALRLPHLHVLAQEGLAGHVLVQARARSTCSRRCGSPPLPGARVSSWPRPRAGRSPGQTGPRTPGATGVRWRIIGASSARRSRRSNQEGGPAPVALL